MTGSPGGVARVCLDRVGPTRPEHRRVHERVQRRLRGAHSPSDALKVHTVLCTSFDLFPARGLAVFFPDTRTHVGEYNDAAEQLEHS
jgi:hypothetical protein